MSQHFSPLRVTWSTLTRRGLMHAALVATVATTLLTACGEDPDPGEQPTPTWYGSWSGASQDYNEPGPPGVPPPMSFNNQTVRQVMTVAMGGDQVRVRFTNLLGKAAITITGARVSRSLGGSTLSPSSNLELKFNGSASVTIPAGGELVSDPAELKVGARDKVVVSMYFAAETPVATVHSLALETSYVSAGNALATETLTGSQERDAYYFISGVEVLSSVKANVVVAIGDSITDGFGTTPGSSRRWTDFLSRRLLADSSAGTVSVLNAGVAGGRMLTDGVGIKGLDRFDRDVLGQSGVTHVIFLLGINDIAFPALVPNQEVSVDQMTAGMQTMIAKAKAKGVKVFAGTLLPFKGATIFGAPYYSADFETKRQAYNSWVRSNTMLDGVIDFDLAMRMSSDSLSMLPAYDSGDHLHPNDAGAEAMANAVDLSKFKVTP
jgi:lysophospholipase L1-like esterase